VARDADSGEKAFEELAYKGRLLSDASATLHLGGAVRYLVSPHKRSTLIMVTYACTPRLS